MRSDFRLLLLLCVTAITTRAQNDQSPFLNLGDSAPPLQVREWIKGTPVQRFEKGNIYVLEYWATWCKPCIAAMPHLSDLAKKYKGTVTILGVDVMEKKPTSMKKIKAFVDSMGHRMDYNIAIEDSNFMVAGWIEASGEQNNGIPRTFVVNAEGKLAWIGHPSELDEVLTKMVKNTWDIKEASTKRNLNKYLAELDRETIYTLIPYKGDAYKKDYVGKPDSALLVIDEIVRKEPGLKYAPIIASHTFSSLLKTNPHKAYEYGKEVLVTPTYQDPAADIIIGDIEWYSDKLNLPLEIYQLGAEAYQVTIDQIVYPELVNIPKLYKNMADMYWRSKNKSKAIEAQQKAIEALKSKKGFSMRDMTAFEFQLQQYKKM